MFGIKFNDLHSYRDLDLIYNTKTISEPVPFTKLVSVPCRNGAIDLSEVLTGNVRYQQRVITMEFTINSPFPTWEPKRTDIANAVHGQKMRIIFDDDLAFYWLGRIEVGDIKPQGSTASITLKATVDPYKYAITSSAEDWLWDPFDFNNGIINETANLVVNGSRKVNLYAYTRWENPIIIASNAMQVKFNGQTYNLVAGSQVVYDIIITEGTNEFEFIGNGTVTINYVGGML